MLSDSSRSLASDAPTFAGASSAQLLLSLMPVGKQSRHKGRTDRRLAPMTESYKVWHDIPVHLRCGPGRFAETAAKCGHGPGVVIVKQLFQPLNERIVPRCLCSCFRALSWNAFHVDARNVEMPTRSNLAGNAFLSRPAKYRSAKTAAFKLRADEPSRLMEMSNTRFATRFNPLPHS